MKQALLFTLFTFGAFSLAAQSTITYENFGEGWVIPLNENLEIDMDDDGIIDFYANQYPDELGFSAIFGIGCFSSSSGNATTSFDARELQLFEEGELIQMNNDNFFDYIDDGRGSGYSITGGLAEGWSDLEDVYVGVGIILPTSGDNIRNGWMKVSIDITKNELIIKEWAFTEIEGQNGGINAGDTGAVTSVIDLDSVESLVLSPNPAQDQVQLSFDYSSTQSLSIVIQNSVGQEVYRNDKDVTKGSNTLSIETLNWSSGTYFVRLQSNQAVKTVYLTISK